ncbi:MarR family winged helix-turn-helix transcriptional regulator [Rhodoligotrophos defluvii]|uniref:MarR family winged helix-turn-helix transcriptional regulator n=1 Tax=Rhodoligotrophos defluvii TaxID=2561934 RepID=UPI0010C98C9B|nr:MarR family transcriptional regulator [Rhodoligotrophos defluvii]
MSNAQTVPLQTTIHVRDTCLCLHVQRAARALARRFDEAFRSLDLTSGQFSLLMSLNRPSPPKMREVASLLAMDRTTLTAALKPLERRGLVSIAVDPKDRRSRLLSLTLAGHRLLAAAAPIWLRTHAQLESQLAGGGDSLRKALGELYEPVTVEPECAL